MPLCLEVKRGKWRWSPLNLVVCMIDLSGIPAIILKPECSFQYVQREIDFRT